MTPTSLPSSPIAPAAAPTTAPITATEVAPADFLLVLGQLIGAGAPATTNSATPASDEKDDATDEAGLDLLAMFPLSLPVTPPNVPIFAGSSAQGSAPLDISGIASQSSSAAAAQAQLLNDLRAADQLSGDRVGAGFDSMQLQPATTEAQQAARTATPSDAVIARPLHQPVGSAAWADEIGSRLTLMVDQGKHTASLRLSPEHLGPLEIRITMRDDQASVWFGAAHADTRAAIETALPRLRELFASQGLSLADAGVFREPPREHAGSASHFSSGNPDAQSPEDASAVIRRVNLALVDAYA